MDEFFKVTHLCDGYIEEIDITIEAMNDFWITRVRLKELRKELGMSQAELATQGATMLATDDLATAAAWFRQRIRIWVAGGEVVRVEHV